MRRIQRRCRPITQTPSVRDEPTHERFKEGRDRYGEAAGEMTVCKGIVCAPGVSLRVRGDWIKP